LHRDLERLKADPMSADAAFNFFVTALHMLDWIYPKRSNNAKREAAEKASVLLQVCSHLGNGAKHFEVEAQKHKSVSSTSESGSWFGPNWFGPNWFGPNWFGEDKLIVHLSGDAATQLGQTIGAIDLAEKVLEYWDKNPDNHPVT
jgi:hypothetical protein